MDQTYVVMQYTDLFPNTPNLRTRLHVTDQLHSGNENKLDGCFSHLSCEAGLPRGFS